MEKGIDVYTVESEDHVTQRKQSEDHVTQREKGTLNSTEGQDIA